MRVGDVLESPMVGQRFTVVELGEDALRFDALIRPGSRTVSHVHLFQEEHFNVREGRLTTWVGGRRRELGPGETATVPARTRHRFRNRGDVDVVAEVALRPALRAAEMFDVLCALDREGRVSRRGVPDPLRSALLIDELGDQFAFPARVPPRVVRAAARPLAAVARRLGVTLPTVG